MIGMVLAAVLASTTFVPAVPAEDVHLVPIQTDAYTYDLQQAGYKNGRMPGERMFAVGGCLLERDAAYMMSLMLEQAARDGVRMSPEWCYRSLSQQQDTYQRNCPMQEFQHSAVGPDGLPLVDETGAVVTVTETRRVCALPTASPSTSNHGWGRAADFVTRGRTLSCGDSAFRWLQANASRYGWVHPDWAQCNRPTAEPWHWEYGGLQVGLPLLTLRPAPLIVPEGVE